jgi:type IV pilus assembly protein PilM
VARTRSVLGLDIGTHSVCAVELTGSGDDVTVTGVGWERIPGPDLVGDTVLALLSENNLKPKSIVTAVSGRLVIVRYVNMAQMPQEELMSAVRYEADKYIPYDVDEVQLACQQLGGVDQKNQMRVLLVAAKNKLIEDHINMLKGISIRPSVIDVDFFALGNAFELCNMNNNLSAEGEAIAIVDIGSSKTSICIMKSDSDCFTREVFTAGSSFTDAVAKRFGEDANDVEMMKEDPGDALEAMQESIMPVLEDIGSEVRLSFDYYENQFDHQVSKVFLSGGSIQFPGVVEALGQIFEIETEKFSPFEYLNVAVDNDIILQDKASDMVVALGLASRIRGM